PEKSVWSRCSSGLRRLTPCGPSKKAGVDPRQLLLPVALTQLFCYRARPVASRDLLPSADLGGTMAKKVTKRTRLELVEAVAERYRSGSRPEKRQILGEFVAVTGYHRKHAIRLLNAADGPRMPRREVRPRVYDEAVREALVVL